MRIPDPSLFKIAVTGITIIRSNMTVIIVVDDPPRKVEGVEEMGVSDHTDHNSLPHLLAWPEVQSDRRSHHPLADGGNGEVLERKADLGQEDGKSRWKACQEGIVDASAGYEDNGKGANFENSSEDEHR